MDRDRGQGTGDRREVDRLEFLCMLKHSHARFGPFLGVSNAFRIVRNVDALTEGTTILQQKLDRQIIQPVTVSSYVVAEPPTTHPAKDRCKVVRGNKLDLEVSVSAKTR